MTEEPAIKKVRCSICGKPYLTKKSKGKLLCYDCWDKGKSKPTVCQDEPITSHQALGRALRRSLEKKLGVIWPLPEGHTINGLQTHISKKGQVLQGVAFPINSKQFRYPFNGYVYLKTRGICYQSVISEVLSLDRPSIPEEESLLPPAHAEEPYVTFLRVERLIELPRTLRLEEFQKMDGTQVRSARNYTQVEDSLDLERERLRFEQERLVAMELYTGMGLSEKVALGLYGHGIFLASQVVIATDNELRLAGVPATKIAKFREKAALATKAELQEPMPSMNDEKRLDVVLPWKNGAGKLLPISTVLNKFVLLKSIQINHHDGLTFGHHIAELLQDKKLILYLRDRFIFEEDGTPFRGFLEGRGEAGSCSLVLHLSAEARPRGGMTDGSG